MFCASRNVIGRWVCAPRDAAAVAARRNALRITMASRGSALTMRDGQNRRYAPDSVPGKAEPDVKDVPARFAAAVELAPGSGEVRGERRQGEIPRDSYVVSRSNLVAEPG